jgi:large subunit ribosomal protein L24
MTKAQIKAAAKPVKMKIRRGDKVIIIAGKDKGEIGFVAAVSPREQKVIVLKETDNPNEPEPLNAVIKHKKAKFQNERSARIKLPAPIHVSNVQLLDPQTGKPTRVKKGSDADGNVTRVAKSGTVIPVSPLPNEK